MASRLSYSLQRKGGTLISVPLALSRAAILVGVGGRPHLSPRLLQFDSVTHYNMKYYNNSLTDPEGMKG